MVCLPASSSWRSQLQAAPAAEGRTQHPDRRAPPQEEPAPTAGPRGCMHAPPAWCWQSSAQPCLGEAWCSMPLAEPRSTVLSPRRAPMPHRLHPHLAAAQVHLPAVPHACARHGAPAAQRRGARTNCGVQAAAAAVPPPSHGLRQRGGGCALRAARGPRQQPAAGRRRARQRRGRAGPAARAASAAWWRPLWGAGAVNFECCTCTLSLQLNIKQQMAVAITSATYQQLRCWHGRPVQLASRRWSSACCCFMALPALPAFGPTPICLSLTLLFGANLQGSKNSRAASEAFRQTVNSIGERCSGEEGWCSLLST